MKKRILWDIKFLKYPFLGICSSASILVFWLGLFIFITSFLGGIIGPRYDGFQGPYRVRVEYLGRDEGLDRVKILNHSIITDAHVLTWLEWDKTELDNRIIVGELPENINPGLRFLIDARVENIDSIRVIKSVRFYPDKLDLFGADIYKIVRGFIWITLVLTIISIVFINLKCIKCINRSFSGALLF